MIFIHSWIIGKSLISEFDLKRPHYEEIIQHLVTLILNIRGPYMKVHPFVNEQDAVIHKMPIHPGAASAGKVVPKYNDEISQVKLRKAN